MFFGPKTPIDEVLRTLAMLPEKGSIRGVARAIGHDKNTICRCLHEAADQARLVTEYYLKNILFQQV
jgi:hypothetical protein